MATVLITLTDAGGDTGPFNLYSNLDGYLSAFESLVSKASLLAGYVSTVVPDGTDIIRVKSMNVICSNYVDLPIAGDTTTTTTTGIPPTTTTTTTEDPGCLNEFTFELSVSDAVPGFPEYNVDLDTPCDSESVPLVSPQTSGPTTMCLCDGNDEVDVRVQRTGLTQDVTNITFTLKDATNALVYSYSWPPILAGNVVDVLYTFTGVADGYKVFVDIIEG